MASTHSNVITRRDPWQNLWRIVTGDRLLAGSLCAIAILLAIAAILPQSPPSNSAAYARWLSSVQIRYGGATGLFTALDLFDVIHSIAFRFLLGVLGLILAARLADRLQDLRRASRPAVPPDIPDHYVDVSQTPDQLAARLRGYPRLRGYRIRRYEAFTHADRYPLAYLAAITAYVGALIILAGLLLSPLVDRRIEAVNLVPHNASPIPGTSYALQASNIDERGEVSLALLQDGLPLAQGMAAAGRPVSGSGISLYVRDLLPALRVSGLDQNGAPLALQISAEGAPAEEVLLTFTADRPDAFFVAPQAGLAVRVSFTGSAGERVYQVSVFGSPSARLITQMQIRPGDRLESDGQQLVFADESHAIVDIVQAPAQFILAAGMLITLLGLAVVVFYPARQVWLTPVESGTRVAYDKTDLAARRMFEASPATSPEDRT